MPHNNRKHRAVHAYGTAGGRIVREGGVHRFADGVLVIGEQGVPPAFGLVRQPMANLSQSRCLGGQVGGRVLFRPLPGRSPLCAGQPPHALKMERPGFGERPGQAQLRGVRDDGRMRLGEGLQVNAGHLPPELAQLSDGGITLRLLLSPVRLTANPVQLRD
ncbi:hypothetical protein ABZT04_03430 [Streptomyces sp. NPDC005492]|uniref:hypothetical protein n=1 Tax=Streptomyces sp. NPDC005492 TaxID=3156883 RepID=UPI0033BC536B